MIDILTMSEIRLQPPGPFNFCDPDDWPHWKRWFQQFRVVSGLAEVDTSKQISTLLYCLGEEAEAVLSSTNVTADDRRKYDRILAKFDEYFQVRKNVIYECARFNRRNQKSGESAAATRRKMIRDRLVVGIRDSALSEKMQMDSKPTLETAKKLICQREAMHE